MSSGHSTISQPDPALKRYEQRVHTMDQLMISFQRWAGSADEDINLLLVGDKIAGSYMRVRWGNWSIPVLQTQIEKKRLTRSRLPPRVKKLVANRKYL